MQRTGLICDELHGELNSWNLQKIETYSLHERMSSVLLYIREALHYNVISTLGDCKCYQPSHSCFNSAFVLTFYCVLLYCLLNK